MLRIAGYRDEALDRSSDALCTALQLTNFWQDFGRDWRAGRLYVPRDVTAALPARAKAISTAGRIDDGVEPRDRGSASTRRARSSTAGRAVCDGVARTAALELRLTWLGGTRILERSSATGAALLDRSARRSAPRDVPLLLWRAARWQRRARLMARKTSFYYSFLVLPAEQRRAIIAVWDFCRAVDDAVDEEPAAAGGLPTGRDAVAFWRAELARVLRRRAAGHATRAGGCSRSSRSSICRVRRSTT